MGSWNTWTNRCINLSTIRSTDIRAADLTGKSGSIQAALNLEISTDEISRFNLKLEGLNGQLPNLDLVNTIVRLCKRESIPPTLQKRVIILLWYKQFRSIRCHLNICWVPVPVQCILYCLCLIVIQMDPMTAVTQTGFQHALKTMFGMMWNQATGMPTGNHGLFHRYHIEAVTLQGVKMKAGKRLGGYPQMGRYVIHFIAKSSFAETTCCFYYLLRCPITYISELTTLFQGGWRSG